MDIKRCWTKDTNISQIFLFEKCYYKNDNLIEYPNVDPI